MDKQFLCAGETYSLTDMMTANKNDDDVCTWLECAPVGDVYNAGMGCDIERIV